MRRIPYLFLALALGAFLPLSAHAERKFDYWDDEGGSGFLTQTNLGGADLARFTLMRNGVQLRGGGVIYGLEGGEILMALSLVDPQGKAWFYQGRGATGAGLYLRGFYFSIDPIGGIGRWSTIDRSSELPPAPAGTIVNSSPSVDPSWSTEVSADAFGGAFYWSLNNQVDLSGPIRGNSSHATWSGILPPGKGFYRVDAFIPVLPSKISEPPTDAARYYISFDFGGSIGPDIPKRLNQQVTSSRWVPLDFVEFSQERYQVFLFSQTPDPDGSRSVVANAIRLVPVQ
jgi:hypothetical protein